ncbi:Endoplasmic reticulum oxidoreductin-1 [Smittium culicis]|uniref:Endoplasmic reticulum oxidoreductin-1 n=1 Tax=Smittium culicis TaxID=133412 RepID=A0A1R1Y5T1_9FUNG|nr:Endoplasmic reticulum oxidoreductin-1 [Smittium culicis]
MKKDKAVQKSIVQRGSNPVYLLFRAAIVATIAVALYSIYSRNFPDHAANATDSNSNNNNNQQQNVPKNVDFMVQVLQKTGGKNICLPNGNILGTSVDFEDVEAINKKISPVLSKLTKTKFFRTVKLDLYKKCDLWENDDVCLQEECKVEQIQPSHIPNKWKSKNSSSFGGFSPFKLDKVKKQNQSPKNFALVYDETEDSEEAVWVDLVNNPEKFTGYAGSSANQIWLTIYQHNCFDVAPFMTDTASGWGDQKTGTNNIISQFVNPPSNSNMLTQFLINLGQEIFGFTQKVEIPLEFQMFYNSVSGLHASTSTHICYDHYNKETGTWSPNLGCFIARIGSFPERLRNIYFNYALLLRSIQRLSPFLKQYNYNDEKNVSDNASSSEMSTKELVNQLTNIAASIDKPFNENLLFKNEKTKDLIPEFKATFMNISRIMDCTGCEKCRLWGKTQILGIGTALKTLFSYGNSDETISNIPSGSSANSPKIETSDALASNFGNIDIKRNEIVALIATFNQFSQSLHNIEHFRSMYHDLLTKYKASGNVEL